MYASPTCYISRLLQTPHPAPVYEWHVNQYIYGYQTMYTGHEWCVCRIMCVSDDECVKWIVGLTPRQVFALHNAKRSALCIRVTNGVSRMMCVSNDVCVESCVRRIMCVSNDVCVESCVCRVMCVSNDVCVEWCVCLAPRQVFALHIAKSTALCIPINTYIYVSLLHESPSMKRSLCVNVSPYAEHTLFVYGSPSAKYSPCTCIRLTIYVFLSQLSSSSTCLLWIQVN